jgi:hypothetical protein
LQILGKIPIRSRQRLRDILLPNHAHRRYLVKEFDLPRPTAPILPILLASKFPTLSWRVSSLACARRLCDAGVADPTSMAGGSGTVVNLGELVTILELHRQA